MEAKATDEIDIQELAVKIIQYFRKHLRFILISSSVGLALSIVIYLLMPKISESKMILLSDILTESYSERITESLDNLIREKNNTALSSRLAITEVEAGQIKSIEIESVKKDKDKNDANIFIVTANIKDKTILPKLQNGIIQFLRNNEYVKIRVRQRKEMYEKLISKLGIEISSLDSLKRRLFLGQPVYSKSSEMLLVDPTNIYSKIIELNKEQINYKNALELVDSIQLVEGFTVFEKPASPKLSIFLIAGFTIGFLFAIGLLTLLQLFKLANNEA